MINIRKNKKYIISMAVILLLVTASLLFTLVLHASAAPAVNTGGSQFKSLTGDASYINCADYYSLDMEETGLMETGYSMLNSIANVLFSFIRWLGKIVTTLFYYCMDFDLAKMFSTEIDSIQKALNNTVFQPLFLLGFCGAALHVLNRFLRRDMVGTFLQVAKVIGILVLSMLVVRESSTVISYTTGIAKDVSTSILISVDNSDPNMSTSSYAAQAAGTLWVNMIHQPWVFIEFGDDMVTREEINQFLSLEYAPGSSNREKLVKNHGGLAFGKERAGEKLGFMFIYLFPLAIKSVIYIVMAILTLAFQLFAVLYVLLAPVILILIMFPGYEGLLSSWLKKIIETQLGILLMSLVMGLLLKVDNLLFSVCANEWGWLTVMIVQTVISIIVIVKRNELIGAISNLSRGSISGMSGVKVRTQRVRTHRDNTNTNASLKNRNIATTGAHVGTRARIAAAGAAVGAAVEQGMHPAKSAIMNGVVAYSEDYAEYRERKKTVERPVMATGKAGANNASSAKGTAASPTSNRNAPVSSPTPQKAVSRPRMDAGKVISVEPVDGRLERVQQRTSETGNAKANIERPVTVQQTANPKPTQRTVRPETAAPSAPRESGKIAGTNAKVTSKTVAVKRPQSSIAPKTNRTSEMSETIRRATGTRK